MDFVEAYTYMFREERWISKLAIGGLVALLSVFILPAFILAGYQVAVVRAVINDEPTKLPEWDNIGQKFMDGLNLFIAGFVYSLPILLVVCLGAVLDAAVGSGSDMAGIFVFLTSCIAILVSIPLAFVVPVLTIRYARTGRLNDLFRFGEVIGETRDNLVDVLLSIVANIGASLVLSLAITVLAITVCGALIVMLVGPVWASV
ncbi:MAG: DUF4013 domain-containing protein, partial [Candidatus Promineifilaceae bacterium]|nr:DUF4013 domain-containing protein [Candidatus Promineifilaceae bacterium]